MTVLSLIIGIIAVILIIFWGTDAMHVFGPVLSRRLGLSLGVDPVMSKACNWNCVYCQLGPTFPRVGERKRFCTPESVLDEIRSQLDVQRDKPIDWVTFVGSGETMLSSDIGEMIRDLKHMTEIPVAVITNGSFLGDAKAAEELSMADAVLPTLDAGSKELYWRINRPLPAFSYDRHIEGLKTFKATYRGKFWLEVMLIKGLNDDENAINQLTDVIAGIAPDEVHLLVPTRPPAEEWVRPADDEALLNAASIMGRVCRVLTPSEPLQDLGAFEGNLPEALKAIVRRHPLREEALTSFLERYGKEEAERLLDLIKKSGNIKVIERMGIRFLVDSSSRHSS